MDKKRREDLPLIAVCTFGVIAVIVILLGIMVCELPVVAVCTIVVIETAMAMCLHNLPIWVHALVIIAELIAGVLCGQMLFIVLAAVIYGAAIGALHFMEVEEVK